MRLWLLVLLLAVVAACVPSGHTLEQQVSPLRIESPLARHDTVYAPIAIGGTYCEHNAVAHALAEMMRHHHGQQRKGMMCHPILVQVAQARAGDMFARKYFGHCDPDGLCPNRYVAEAGYKLPGHYPSDGNSVESIAANQKGAATAFQSFLDSPPHRRHVLGEIRFFREQNCYGVGFSGTLRRGDWISFPVHRAYVIITAPCP
jgi:hypothetical protein